MVLKRKIIFGDKVLTDIPGLTLEELRKFYSTEYPELCNSGITKNIDEENQLLEVTFTGNLGTKG